MLAILLAAAAAPAAIEGPVVLEQPTAEDLVRAYPKKAARVEARGQVLLTCRVTRVGRLGDCQVLSENPPGYGFAAAARQIAARFRLGPFDRDGLRTAGRRVELPVKFDLPKS